MRYFSMFSGIGGFELGIHHAYRNKNIASQGNPPSDEKTGQGLVSTQGQDSCASQRSVSQHDNDDQGRCEPSCIGYCEIDRYADSIYQRHFKGHRNYGDARKVVPRELADFDLLVGGFPCQAFSIAGRRGGFDDTRGTLFFEIARIAQEKRPHFLLLENVKGLLSHDQGKTFGTILNTLDELGYDLQWQVLNSAAWVPQNRERVFIIGHLRGERRPEVFPIEGNNRKGLEELTSRADEASRVYSVDGAARTIKNGGGMGAKTGLYAVDMSRKTGFNKKEVFNCLDASYYKGLGNQQRPAVMESNKNELYMVKDPSRNKGPELTENSPTLRSECHGNLPSILSNSRIRRLTPIECERLQGFPDNWTEYDEDGKKISDAQRYKCLGNAVTVNVIEAIMRRLL